MQTLERCLPIIWKPTRLHVRGCIKKLSPGVDRGLLNMKANAAALTHQIT